MRIMQKGSVSLKVVKHIITKNFWEFYIIDDGNYKPDSDIQFAFVMGAECEFGDIDLAEIRPYISSETTNLKNVLCAKGYQWKESKKKCKNCDCELKGEMIFHPKLCFDCVLKLETKEVVENYLKLAKRKSNANS